MAGFELEVVAKADAATTFTAFSDVRNLADELSGIVRVEVLTDGPIQKGTRFRETRVMFKKETTEEMEFSRFDAPNSYTVDCESCGSHFESTFRFLADGAETRVQARIDCRPLTFWAKVFSPLSGLMMGTMKKCILQDMNEAAALAEKMAAS